MKIKIALLKKAHITVLTRIGKRPIMLLQMIMHRGLNARRVLTMSTRELAISILSVNKNHFSNYLIR